MDKEWFDKTLQDSELPKEDIMRAIQDGMNDGRKIKRKNKVKSRMKLSAWVTGTAASVVLASGFVFSPVNTVLAEMPLIGKLYETFNFEIGKELSASNLVTELNQKATSNGVDVTVTSAYYDGNVIGVTIKAEGEDLSLEEMDKGHGPESGYALGGDDREQLAGARGVLKKAKDGSYVAALEFEMRNEELPKDYTLSFSFISMANIRGDWQFDVPVKQLSLEKFMVNEKGSSKDGNYTMEIKSLSIGKATATLEYTSTHPLNEMDEGVNIKILDDQGNEVSLRSNGVLKQIEDQNSIRKLGEVHLGKIKDSSKFLTVYAEVVKKNERIYLAPIKINLTK
ncbi:DUF4179 domain-containing protein [Fictibacillus nanhaiensis]|uniref:DUF4179 domain-containing protein n=1 Tax=Fictibacillus nanhaiensis TaxID=742169 RepID=UPI001C944C72|nr:DUF4179 domain-containing protein [Fictibacillus nanhaiensis]MBY6038155.1 DUF4179 domain-containing protein [Fictibacillus nanhaiensis]